MYVVGIIFLFSYYKTKYLHAFLSLLFKYFIKHQSGAKWTTSTFFTFWYSFIFHLLLLSVENYQVIEFGNVLLSQYHLGHDNIHVKFKYHDMPSIMDERPKITTNKVGWMGDLWEVDMHIVFATSFWSRLWFLLLSMWNLRVTVSIFSYLFI